MKQQHDSKHKQGVTVWFISGSLTRPFKNMIEITSTMAGGDLSKTISSSDRSEIGLLINSLGDMNKSLKAAFAKIIERSDRLSNFANNLLSNAVQTGRASEQVSTSAEEVARAAAAQAEDAQRTSQLAQQVGLAMQNVGTSTQRISEQSIDFQGVVKKVTGLMLQQKDKMDHTMGSKERKQKEPFPCFPSGLSFKKGCVP